MLDIIKNANKTVQWQKIEQRKCLITFSKQVKKVNLLYNTLQTK